MPTSETKLKTCGILNIKTETETKHSHEIRINFVEFREVLRDYFESTEMSKLLDDAKELEIFVEVPKLVEVPSGSYYSGDPLSIDESPLVIRWKN